MFSCPPKTNPMYTYRETLSLGHADVSVMQVNQILRELSHEWPGCSYDLLSHNCNHFCEEFCAKLGVQKLPCKLNLNSISLSVYFYRATFLSCNFGHLICKEILDSPSKPFSSKMTQCLKLESEIYHLGMTKFEADLRYATVAGQCGSIDLQMWVMLQLKLLGTPWRGYGSYSSTFTFVSTGISTSESALVHLIGAKTPDV